MTTRQLGVQDPNVVKGSQQRPVRRRSMVHTSYRQEMRLFNTLTKRVWTAILAVVLLVLPFVITDNLLQIIALGCAFTIGATGLNIVTGYAGQVSLGHAFFLGVGAYTASAIAGDPAGRTIGFGITFFPVWLIGAGLVAAGAGAIVAPLAFRLRGLYLAVVTVGLVFLGEYIFAEWTSLTGGPGVGRSTATPELFGVNLRVDNALFTSDQQMYLLMLSLMVFFMLLAKNIVRSRLGRAFSALRDRDVAAEVIGVSLWRYKLTAFVVSSFFAGVCGALVYSLSGFVDPTSFGLLLSVQFIAMVLIGGAGTIAGGILGAFFITLLPLVTRQVPRIIPFVSADPIQPVNIFLLETLIYGLLIVGFLIFEPRGLFGLWIRLRRYWDRWPFSY